MKTLAQRLQEVRAWVATHTRDVPSMDSYIRELDAITHELAKRPHEHVGGSR